MRLHSPPVLQLFQWHPVWHWFQRHQPPTTSFYVSVWSQQRELLANMLTGSCCSAGTSKFCGIIMGCILAHQISPMSSEKHIHSLYADVERRSIVSNICSLWEQIIFISCRKLNKGCLFWHNGQISLEEQQKDFRGVASCHPKNKSKQVSFPAHMACESPWYLLLTVLTAREAWMNTSGVPEPEARSLWS